MRGAEPAERLDDDHDRAREQQQAVALRDEHLGASEPERVSFGGRALRDAQRGVRDREHDHVGRHVRGVGEQRERPERESADHLDREEDGVRDEREHQGATTGVSQRVDARILRARGLRMPRARPLGAGGLPPEQLLDVGAQLLLGGRPAVRADPAVDGRQLDRPPLVRRLVDREAELQRPGRGRGIEIGRLPREQRVDERGRGAPEGAVVRRVELGERGLAAVLLVEHDRRETDVQVAAEPRHPDEAARALDLEELVGAVVVAADEHVGRVRDLHHAEQVVAVVLEERDRRRLEEQRALGERPTARCECRCRRATAPSRTCA